MQALLHFLVLEDVSWVRGANCKGEEEEALLSSLEPIMVEPFIPNQGPFGNLHSAIILIRLGLISLISLISFHGWLN